jgi:hypothetical protein
MAVEAGEAIGTIRANLPSLGSLGVLEELYGMRRSPHYPAGTGVCTKFIVKRSRRKSLTAIKLMGALVRFGAKYNIRECYIDCIPNLLPFYRALGFTQVGELFFHRENGPSYPMVIDLVENGDRLTGGFASYDALRRYLKANVMKWLDRS